MGAPAQKATDMQMRTGCRPSTFLLQQSFAPVGARPSVLCRQRTRHPPQHRQLFLCCSSSLTYRKEFLHVLGGKKNQNLETSNLSRSPPRFDISWSWSFWSQHEPHTQPLVDTWTGCELECSPSAWLDAVHPSVPPEMSRLQGRLLLALMFLTRRWVTTSPVWLWPFVHRLPMRMGDCSCLSSSWPLGNWESLRAHRDHGGSHILGSELINVR